MMLPRSWALIVPSSGFLATPLAAGAQQPSKQARIVVIGNVPLPVYENFTQRLRKPGWTEGQNITIETDDLAREIRETVQLPFRPSVLTRSGGPPSLRADPLLPLAALVREERP